MAQVYKAPVPAPAPTPQSVPATRKSGPNLLILLLMAVLVIGGGATVLWFTVYAKHPPAEIPTVTIADLRNNPGKFDGKSVRVRANILSDSISTGTVIMELADQLFKLPTIHSLPQIPGMKPGDIYDIDGAYDSATSTLKISSAKLVLDGTGRIKAYWDKYYEEQDRIDTPQHSAPPR